MFRMISESMLANVIAFEEAGVPLRELVQAGRTGSELSTATVLKNLK